MKWVIKMRHEIDPLVKKYRKATFDVDPLFLNRWSARSISPEPIPDDELFALFEAARWAPSSYNDQFWRFIIGRGEHKKKFVDLLTEGNKKWASKAPVLVVVTARKVYSRNGHPARTYQFDAGAAWMSLALEATRRGLVAHPMGGFDHEKARVVLNIPDDHDVLIMIAIGRKDNPNKLPPDIREREKPNTRLPLKEIVHEGEFGRKVSFLPDA